MEPRPNWGTNISAVTWSSPVSAGSSCCQPQHHHWGSSSPTRAAVKWGLRGTRGPTCSCKVPERDSRRELAQPVSERHVTAWRLCNVLSGGELLLAPVQVLVAAVSREERGCVLLPWRKAPFWAVRSSQGWKAPPELVLQVSSFCLFWETDLST